MGSCCTRLPAATKLEIRLDKPLVQDINTLDRSAILIQKHIRGFITRKKLSQTGVGDSSLLQKSVEGGCNECLAVVDFQEQIKLIKDRGTILEKIPVFENVILQDIVQKHLRPDPQQADSGSVLELFVDTGPVKLKDGYFQQSQVRNMYIGQWLNGKRHGKGCSILQDGSYYDGDWKEDKADGQGCLVHQNGEIYEGEWSRDKAHGFGKYIREDVTYEGNWFQDKQHGQGVETWKSGDRYEGEFSMGQKQGLGTFHWSDKSMYEGNFYENNLDGKGTYTWPDGRVVFVIVECISQYCGEWQNNLREGYGEFKWPDGRTYRGHFQADNKEGYGTLEWPDGRIYQGMWKDGVQHGDGTFVTKQGFSRKGTWEQGKRVTWIKSDTQFVDQSKSQQYN